MQNPTHTLSISQKQEWTSTQNPKDTAIASLHGQVLSNPEGVKRNGLWSERPGLFSILASPKQGDLALPHCKLS